jgi:hypothetical protein
MHTYQGHARGGGYHFIFDQKNTSVAFFQLLVNVGFAAGVGALLAQVPKRFLIISAMIVAVYVGITSITAMIYNDYGNDLFTQRKYTEAAQAYHQAAIWWRAALRPDQAHEDDTYSSYCAILRQSAR